MKTTDLFKANRSAQRLNESLEKTFGKRLDLASFDLPKLEDARNKLRTQLSQARGQSGFNENLENEAVTQAQFMLDAINAEIAEREEFIADPSIAAVEEGMNPEVEEFLEKVAKSGDDAYDMIYDAMGRSDEVGSYLQDMASDISREHRLHPDDDIEDIIERMVDNIDADYGGSDDEGGDTDDAYALASAGHGSDEDYGSFGYDESIEEKAPPGAKAERMVKHIKKGYAKDGNLTDKEKGIAYATAWKQHNKEKNETIQDESSDFVKGVKRFIKGKKNPSDVRDAHLAKATFGDESDKDKEEKRYDKVQKLISKESIQGESMTKLREGEVQQASAIVTAKTMVDRVSRWIEELSGMENDTLLQLGDSIRDEMGQEQAKSFISAVAPAIQQALENLKTTRETLATGVRTLTGEEQGAEMLGGEPGAEGGDEMGAAEPDAMNMGDEMGPPEEGGEDEFAAAEPAAGGLEASGREQRESIDRSNSLLRVLAG